jgi:hypothetical protein
MLIDHSPTDSLAYAIDRDFAIDAMGLDYYASSPVLLSSQNHSHHLMSQQHHEGGAVLEPSPAAFQQQPSPFPFKKFVSRYPKPPSLNYLARASNDIAGRKRSRDDDNDDHESELETSTRTMAVASSSAPILRLGLGQTHSVSPKTCADSWMEESMDQDPQSSAEGAARPRIISRKSQRTLGGEPTSSRNNHEEIDPIVLQLGIGWRRPAESQASAIAGSEAFIRNQYPLSEPRILLHHEGLGIYVVRTEPASAKDYWHQWWLFRDDLKSCRFLCNDDNDLFRRLNHKHEDARGNWIPNIIVEGPEVFARDVPPSPISALSPVNGVMVAQNVEQMQQSQGLASLPREDVEMEGIA